MQRLKRVAKAMAVVLCVWLLGYAIVFYTWNDQAIARTINRWASTNLRGAGGPTRQALVIGRVHYPYFDSMRSLLTSSATRFDAWDVKIWDAQGELVIAAPHVRGRIYVRTLVANQILSLLHLEPYDLELHFAEVEVSSIWARIAPTPSPNGAINLIQAFSARVPRPVTNGGMHIRVDALTTAHLDFTLTLPGWIAHLPDAAVRGMLRYSSFTADNTDRERPAFTYRLSPLTARSAELRMATHCPAGICRGDESGDYVLHFRDLHMRELASPEAARNEMRFAATARVESAPTDLSGALLDIYSGHPRVDLQLAFRGGDELIRLIPVGSLLGGSPRGRVRIHGPLADVVFDGEMAQGEIRLAGLIGTDTSTRFHLAQGKLELSQIRTLLGGSAITGSFFVDFARLAWHAALVPRGIDPARLSPHLPLPRSLLAALAGRLDGQAEVRGSFDAREHPERVTVRHIDARLVRRQRDSLPRTIHLAGDLRLWPTLLHLDGMAVSGDGVTVSARGQVALARRQAAGALTVDARLETLLARLGLPDLVRQLSAVLHVEGALDEPSAQGNLVLRDVGYGSARLPKVEAGVELAHGTLYARRIRGAGLGGTLGGSAADPRDPGDSIRLDLFDGSFARPRRPPTITATLRADRLRLHSITTSPNVHGELNGRVALNGPLSRPGGTVDLLLPELKLYDDRYQNGEARIVLGPEGLTLSALYLERQERGKLFGKGTIGYDGVLDTELTAISFPVAALPPLRGLPVAGVISGKLNIGGTTRRPLPAGSISISNGRLREFFLGDGTLHVEPGGDAIRMSGDFFDRFHVEGFLTLAPTLGVNVVATFRELQLTELLPELKQLGEVSGHVSGQVRISYAKDAPPYAELRLDSVVLSLRSEEGDPGDVAEKFQNDGVIILTTDFDKVEFKQARLRSQKGGLFSLEGRVAARDTDLRINGRLNLTLFEYFTAGLFTHTDGDAVVDVHLLGAVARPKVLGSIKLLSALLQPRGAQRPFRASGLIEFVERKVKLSNLTLELDHAQTQASGWIELDNWLPGELLLDVRGELPAELLEWFYSDYFTDVDRKGVFGVSARLVGPWSSPTWSGRIDIHNVALRLRKNVRDIRIPGGTIILEKNRLHLGCPESAPPAGCQPIAARIDETGDLRLRGTLALRGLALEQVDVSVDGQNLDWGAGQVYSLTLSPHVRLTGSSQQLRLAGQVLLVSGTYKQDFEVLRDLVIRPRTAETEPPFYEGVPLLEELQLDLSASSSGPMSIRNNLAPSGLQMSFANLRIGGTLGRPTFQGSVAIEEGGVFRIPLLRADFTTDRSSVSFEAAKEFPSDTPALDINASSDWTDRYEQLHHITLRVFGTLREPNLELSSTDGWDKNQVLSALATGSAPDDLRRLTQVDPSSSRTSTPTIVQTASSDLLFNFAEDPLKSVFKLEFLRIELGYIKACYFNRREFKLCGTGEGQLAPTSNLDARAELKLSDDFAAFIAAQHLENSIERSELVINRLRLQLRWKIPLY